MSARDRPAAGTLLEAVRCPRCAAALDVGGATIACAACGAAYPRLGDVPVLLPEPAAYLRSCRRQLVELQRHAERTVASLHEQLAGADVLPATRVRGRAMIAALERQLADVRGLVAPLLGTGGAAGAGGDGAADRAHATIEYLGQLYRDWGWPSEPGGENERALALTEALRADEPLGRTLVIGAGACRLAYDLHRRHPEAELLVLDLDPVLFTAARAITRGDTVAVQEANLEIGELAQAATEWRLAAPDGPVDEARFHFLLADGVDPPLQPGSVDTVLTPWFIDDGPDDVRDFMSTVHRLLRPGGRWLNQGPLLYHAGVPIAQRFAREELFDLIARAGFRIDRWRTESGPHLVSRLNQRGKVEWVLGFAATRLEADVRTEGSDGPPAWLLFRHLAVPTFPGQSMFWSENPGVRLLVSAIDGRRTLDDLAALVASRAGERLPVGQVRAAVRQALAEVHPAARAPRADGGPA